MKGLNFLLLHVNNLLYALILNDHILFIFRPVLVTARLAKGDY